MASNKIVTIQCPALMKDWIEQSLRFYAEAAHPPGGSECSMVARDSLLTAADNISKQGTTFTISRRIKPKLKAAIKYFFENKSQSLEQSQKNCLELTLKALNGEIISDEALQATLK